MTLEQVSIIHHSRTVAYIAINVITITIIITMAAIYLLMKRGADLRSNVCRPRKRWTDQHP
jgi:hypothetical protein